MSDKPYEDMSDRELEELTEETLREHESGGVRFQHRDPSTTRECEGAADPMSSPNP
jgi:hypothetical protein